MLLMSKILGFYLRHFGERELKLDHFNLFFNKLLLSLYLEQEIEQALHLRDEVISAVVKI